MAEIFVCPKGSITRTSIKALAKAGVVVVQSSEPDRCKFIRAGQVVSSNDLLWCAMKALQNKSYGHGENQREEFAKVLWDIVNDQRVKHQARRDASEAKLAVSPAASEA